ncbi:NUDIX hydrolase [Streptomyces avicenniae]|uniref:NUDIX hydrolase n=1 Tax=Streptomyces avicenniae TaxID=500153 RepID=UPI00069958EC|nr:NUDIX domain-containing protein [Streptomyces avicenniae]
MGRSRWFPADWPRRVGALARGELTPVTPRPSATVLLLRDGAAGIEVFLLRRRPSMAFAAGMYAYPGGAVEPGDASPAHTAVRETYEETGVLLAGPADGPVPERPGDAPFAALLARRGLVPRTDLLAPWARWITPEFEPRRYDTWFWLAVLPEGQRCRNASTEADRTAWLRPADALAHYARGTYAMLPPTVATLRRLVPYADAAARAVDVRDAAAASPPPEPVLARVGTDGDALVVRWPGHAEFDIRLPNSPPTDSPTTRE